MRHQLPMAECGPAGPGMAEAIRSCVHCGFCLPACPTYTVLGQETDSPRGRIFLMKEALEGSVPTEQVLPHVDRCLGCLACETACPSGVRYHELLAPFRERAEKDRKRSLIETFKRVMTLETLPYPNRFRWALRFGRWTRPLARFAPKALRPMLALLPDHLPASETLPEISPAIGTRRARVALLAGCAQQVLDPSINRDTIEVLTRQGVEVVIPKAQGCCGALAWHVGDGDRARVLAEKNLTAFPEDVDAIVTNAAGCGSGLHDYPAMFRGMDQEAAAHAFADRVVDVSVFLDRLGLQGALSLPEPTRVAYHDACHLAHAQGVRSAPRSLLRAINNVELVEIPSGDLCCGSAGTYNLDQPDIAGDLGRRKAETIRSTGAALVTAGNIGCLVQIQTHLKVGGAGPEVLHTMNLLARAHRQSGI